MNLEKYVEENCSPVNTFTKTIISKKYLQLAREELRSHPIGSSAFTKRVKNEFNLSDDEAKELRVLFDRKVNDWQQWVAAIFSEMKAIQRLPQELISLLMMQAREMIYCHNGKFRYNLRKSTMQSASECFLEGFECPRCDGYLRGCNYQCADLCCDTCEHSIEIKMRSSLSVKQRGQVIINFGIPEGVKRWYNNGTLVLVCQGGALFWDAKSTVPSFPEYVGSLDSVTKTKRKTDVMVQFHKSAQLQSSNIDKRLLEWGANLKTYADIMGNVMHCIQCSLSKTPQHSSIHRQIYSGLNDFLQLVKGR